MTENLDTSISGLTSRLNEIRAIASDDDEEAHMLEDQLWVDALEAIADGYTEPQMLAKQVLQSQGITFSRWYA